MLGWTHSGKTVFLLAMYAALNQSIDGYYLSADQDTDLDLREAWEDLTELGTLPLPNSEVPQSYDFSLVENLETLAEVNVTDFRGSAVRARTDSKDAKPLLDRLIESDSIYVVLDGQLLRDWLVDPSGPPPRDLHLAKTNDVLLRTLRARQDAKRELPSIVLLITKMDLLTGIPGLPRPAALRKVPELLEERVPVLFTPGVTALLCPVSVGTFDESGDPRSIADSIKPVGVARPLAFSLRHIHDRYIARESARLRGQELAHVAVETRLDDQRSSILRRFYNRKSIRIAEELIRSGQQRLRNDTEELRGVVSMADRLRAQVGNLPVLRDGKLGWYLSANGHGYGDDE
ncbi:hypothetical protein ACN265_32045 [Micromonospora sp. WMMD730]|uniref:hypothetical protein n=1 Tax=Micromonospora sp. WMMD730 TaxID=3404128 RepID=UPI003B95458A